MGYTKTIHRRYANTATIATTKTWIVPFTDADINIYVWNELVVRNNSDQEIQVRINQNSAVAKSIPPFSYRVLLGDFVGTPAIYNDDSGTIAVGDIIVEARGVLQ
jgi:hypothetical protein